MSALCSLVTLSLASIRSQQRLHLQKTSGVQSNPPNGPEFTFLLVCLFVHLSGLVSREPFVKGSDASNQRETPEQNNGDIRKDCYCTYT